MRAIHLVSALVGLTLAGGAFTAQAADSPQDAYHLDLTCASAAAAANVDTKAQTMAEDRAKAEQLAQQTLAIAQSSGRKVGLTPIRVQRSVDGGSDRLLQYLRQPDQTKAATERTELGRVLIKCAMVHAMAG